MALDERQTRAVELEVAGADNMAICGELKVGSRTLAMWRKTVDYQMALLEFGRKKFASLVPSALKAIERLLANPNTGDMAVIRAAELVLKGAQLVTDSRPGPQGYAPEQEAQVGVLMLPRKKPVSAHNDGAQDRQTVVATPRPVTMDSD